MIPLHDIQALCAGKSVAIVGNSARLLDQTHGPRIDASDVVVRMNHGYPRAHTRPATGSRTDIWACSFNNKPLQARELPLFDPVYVLSLPADKRHIHDALRPRLHLDAPEHVRELRETLGGNWPSTGALAVHFFLDTVNVCGSITLFGYDHFQTPNFFQTRKRANHDRHSPQAERRYVEDLTCRGKVAVM